MAADRTLELVVHERVEPGSGGAVLPRAVAVVCCRVEPQEQVAAEACGHLLGSGFEA